MRWRKLAPLGLVVMGVLFLAAACGGTPEKAGDCLEAQDGRLVSVPCIDDSGQELVPTPTATALPTDGNGGTTNGGGADGLSIFLSQGTCFACHAIDGVPQAQGQVGPNLTLVGARGEAYVRESIVDPNAVIAEECPGGPCASGLMPQTFAQTLSEDQIDALVIYLLALQ